MLLAIDVGNTNVVFALFDGEKLLGSWRSWTNSRRSGDEYGVWLAEVFNVEGLDRSKIKGAIISCVVPDMLHSMMTLCERYFDVDPLVVGDKGVDVGVVPLVDRPEDVGADRLVNTLAAVQIMPGPLVVVDFGTATTFDVVDEAGNFVGGIIAPGVNISMEALNRAAARLPRVAIQKPKKVVGKATIPALQSGSFWGTVAMVEGMILRIEEETDAEMNVIATGGLCELFADATEIITHADPDLTLRGLQLVYQRNARAKKTLVKG